ncbi:MAG: DUF2877 domain-containing protein [Actinomycetaceae bacterium]|nr:DUF2877 domain-containing protein [Actinomycetaceae bacterium]
MSSSNDAGYPASLGVGLERERNYALPILSLIKAGDTVEVEVGETTTLRFDTSAALTINDSTREESTLLPTDLVVSNPTYEIAIADALTRSTSEQPNDYPRVTATIAGHVRQAIRAAIQDNLSECSLALRQVIGLGFGLTPSGDDTVIGALAYTRLFASNAYRCLAAAVSQLVDRTTSISASYLTLSSQGYFSHHISRALRGFCGDPSSTALTDLFAMGHSSGEDTARGILLAHQTTHP